MNRQVIGQQFPQLLTSQQDLTNWEASSQDTPFFSPPPFSLPAQEPELPVAQHTSIVPSILRSKSTSGPSQPNWGTWLLPVGLMGQRGTLSVASAQSLLASHFYVLFAWSQALGSPGLSAWPPPAYHLPQSPGRGGKWDTNEIQSETKSGGVANSMEEGDRT